MTQSLGEFPSIDSPLHRLDPRWKSIGLAGSAATVVALTKPESAVCAALATLVLLRASRWPLEWYRARFEGLALAMMPFLVVMPLLGDEPFWNVGPLRVSRTGAWAALLLALKAFTLTALALVATSTASTADLLKAAAALRVPALLIRLIALSGRYVSLLADELARLRIALRVRAYRHRATLHSYRTVGHITGTLLARGAERADRVGQAMRCRGFDGSFKSLTNFHTRSIDLAFALSLLGIAATLFWLDRVW